VPVKEEVRASGATDDNRQAPGIAAIKAFLGRTIRHPTVGPVVAGLLLYGLFAWEGREYGFVTELGTTSWLNVSSELCLLAMPYTLLMIAGEFDLSIGSTIGATSMVLAVGVSHYDWPVGLVVVVSLLLGVVIGVCNGLLVVRTKLPSFVATIGTNFVIAGATLGMSRILVNTSQMSVYIHGFAHSLFAGQWRSFDASILWALAATALVTWVMMRTRYGNWIYAIGGNVEAARRAGVPTDRIKVGLFVLTSIGAVLVAVIQTVEYSTGNATAGQGFLFQVPIVVVVGGILVSGGYGSPVGVVFGCMIYGIVSLGIFYAGWNTDWAAAFLGGLMVIAVIANNYVRRLALSRGQPTKGANE
jgi:simple sugar transport system permease protein